MRKVTLGSVIIIVVIFYILANIFNFVAMAQDGVSVNLYADLLIFYIFWGSLSMTGIMGYAMYIDLMGDSKNISTSPQPEEPPKELTKKEIWLEQYKKDQLFVGSFLSYIMQTKQVVAITPFGNYEITLKFQDGTSMNVWVANKYYAFAMCGEYFGKTNRIKWNRVWLISEDSAKLFEQWFTNSFNNYKRFELDSVDIEGKFKSDEEEIPESSKYIQK